MNNEIVVTVEDRVVRPIHVEATGFNGTQFLNLNRREAVELLVRLQEVLSKSSL